MKILECDYCAETLVLASEPRESVTDGETPLEHMERTGHSPRSLVTLRCNDCENVWPYTGDADRPTCPNCAGKRTEPVDGPDT